MSPGTETPTKKERKSYGPVEHLGAALKKIGMLRVLVGLLVGAGSAGVGIAAFAGQFATKAGVEQAVDAAAKTHGVVGHPEDRHEINSLAREVSGLKATVDGIRSTALETKHSVEDVQQRQYVIEAQLNAIGGKLGVPRPPPSRMMPAR
jgi:hypothetical protein